MCHVETRSVVADEIGVLPLVAAAAELDAGRRAPGGELPGVAQQVLQSDLQQLGIAPYDHGRLAPEVRHPVRRVRLQVLAYALCQRADIDLLQHHIGALHAGGTEEIVNQNANAMRTTSHPSSVKRRSAKGSD